MGDFPSGTGTPTNPVWPYDEHGLWGDGSQSSTGVLQAPGTPPDIGAPIPAPVELPNPYNGASSHPDGQSDRPWINPTTYATVPINVQSGNGATPVLSLNFKRNSLIIQNTSTATVVGDTAPTLYVGFNAAPLVLGSLALPPGLGFFWDVITPRDSIFVLFGPFVNVGLSVVISGCVVQGTYVPTG